MNEKQKCTFKKMARCQAEYENDRSLLSERQTALKNVRPKAGV